jgi:hypothetical protein
VISIHTGLGLLDAKTGVFSNTGFVGTTILSKLNMGAVLLNYDRGECVDVQALDKAMKSGRVRYAAIDADLFVNGKKVTGPLAPYLPLAKAYKGRLELLPHAAADTEHVSRVEGAKQAVDQIIDAIRYKRVVNLKGDCPTGYSIAGAVTRRGVGRAGVSDITSAVADVASLSRARDSAETVAGILAALATTTQADALGLEINRHGAALVKAANTLASTFKKLGLEGPFES